MRLRSCLFAGLLALSLQDERASAEEPRASTIDVRQGKLHYLTLGKVSAAVPLIALNGGPGLDHAYLLDSHVWQGLSKKRQIIFYDQRATGLSRTTAPYSAITIDLLLTDLEALRARLGAPRIALLGHSWGGILAMAYAIRHPNRVSNLILVGSGSPKPAEHEFLFDRIYPEIVARHPPDPSPAGKVGCVSIEEYERMSYYDQRNRPRSGRGGFSQDVCTHVMHQALKLDLFPQLRRLRVPTLVINGRFDANVAPTVAYAISKAIKGSQLVYFEQSGHSPFIEEPDRFELVVGNFLDGQAAAGEADPPSP